MAKKKPEPAPEALSFMELTRKVGNETVASLRKEIAEGKLQAGKKKTAKSKRA
jgi:hypothetical protein